MATPPLDDVFTVREVARATGASPEQVEDLRARSPHRRAGTKFLDASEAMQLGVELRRAQRRAQVRPPDIFTPAHEGARKPGIPAFASSAVHGALFAVVLALSAIHVAPAATEVRSSEPARLVFVVSPGPGGGGGGGGLRNPLPTPRLERKAPVARKATSVPPVALRPSLTTRRDVPPPKRPTPPPAPTVAVAEKPKPEPEPLPTVPVVAPVVAAASDARDRQGVIERGQGDADSQGSGTGGGAGTGHGTGNGEGLGSGIGDGSGGGTGGGPYRPGSGIEPPRLVREVKADYTDEARRRGITGDVLLEIVVRRDGTVGDVRVVQGLGGGLEQRAIQAVRQWRFEPARRKGVPVDVLVEVAVEFLLR